MKFAPAEVMENDAEERDLSTVADVEKHHERYQGTVCQAQHERKAREVRERFRHRLSPLAALTVHALGPPTYR